MYLALLLLSTLPRLTPPTEQVDLVELNHYYEDHDDAKWLFDQVIFYEWNRDLDYFEVRDHRLMKVAGEDYTRRDMALTRVHAHGYYLASWRDYGKHYQVIARHYRETWTQYDPELVEREKLPKEKRRLLFVKP
jgi:hypothetical protein